MRFPRFLLTWTKVYSSIYVSTFLGHSNRYRMSDCFCKTECENVIWLPSQFYRWDRTNKISNIRLGLIGISQEKLFNLYTRSVWVPRAIRIQYYHLRCIILSPDSPIRCILYEFLALRVLDININNCMLQLKSNNIGMALIEI